MGASENVSKEQTAKNPMIKPNFNFLSTFNSFFDAFIAQKSLENIC